MTTSQVLSLVRPNIASLIPYSTARDEYKGELGILLDANENPFGDGLNRYPSTSLRSMLLQKVAGLRGVRAEEMFLGNGSDECIDLCYRVFCRPGTDNAITISPSYGMYTVCADINDIECRQVPLGEDFNLPVGRILEAADERTRLLFVCSPNNPTANSFAAADIEKLLEDFRGMVVLDEAYIDFSAHGSLASLVARHPNLIVLQTLSKAYALAGLRIGLAIAIPEVVEIFDKVRYPYNIGTDTLKLAIDSISEDATRDQVGMILTERERLRSALAGIPCIREVLPSDANFFLVRCESPRELYSFLTGRGIIVRDRSTTPLCGPALRITVGTPTENNRLIQAITEYDRIQGTVH